MSAIETFARLLSQIDPRCPDHAPLHNVLPNNGPTVGDFRALMAEIARPSVALVPPDTEGEAQPVAYASAGQMDALEDRPDDPGGVYIPLRKTALGNFQMPLFASPRPAVSEAMVGPVEAAHDLLEACDRDHRTIGYRADLWDCLRAALAAVPGKEV